jgi:hypothetical protein
MKPIGYHGNGSRVGIVPVEQDKEPRPGDWGSRFHGSSPARTGVTSRDTKQHPPSRQRPSMWSSIAINNSFHAVEQITARPTGHVRRWRASALIR